MPLRDRYAIGAEMRERLHQAQLGTVSAATFLKQVTVLAAETIDAQAACGIMLLRDGEPVTIASSDERAHELDEAQIAASEGPCLDASITGEVIRVHDLAADDRWSAHTSVALEQGVRSVLCLPMTLAENTVGAIDIYAFEPYEFNDVDFFVLDDFRVEAARAITLALRYQELVDANGQLRAGMVTRRLIDQAVGIIMAQSRCGSDQAFEMLRQASQNRNVKVRDLAYLIISRATDAEVDEDLHWK